MDGIALAWEEAFLEVTRGENALETLPPGARMEVLAERRYALVTVALSVIFCSDDVTEMSF